MQKISNDFETNYLGEYHFIKFLSVPGLARQTEKLDLKLS